MSIAQEIRLKTRPSGLPTADNFEVAEVELPDPAPGEVQVRNTWMSVDPYMRGRMNDVRSYVPPFQVGRPLEGGAVGVVAASNATGLKPGDLVQSLLGWRTAFNAPASQVQKIEPGELPPQAFLGVAGMPGLTAYAGLQRIAGLKDGDVVFVSGAAGAVGSMACMIAKARGHRVIGSAGGPEKVAFLREIGVDAVIDYKAEEDLALALKEAAPDGIDVYFDNVGGDHLAAALTASRPFARFALCGAISMYNDAQPPPGPRNLMLVVGRQLSLRGFLVSSHWDLMPEFQRELAGWLEAGRIRWRETVFEGLDRAPEAFIGLFTGENIGKMLVKL